MILNTLMDIGLMRIFFLIKLGVKFIFIITPIVLMYQAITYLVKNIINPNDSVKNWKEILYKMICALVVFLIPTIINYAISLVESDNTKIIALYNKASQEEIEKLEKTYEAEVKAENAKKIAEQKEGLLKQKEEEKRRYEQLEEQRKQSELEEERQRQQQQQQQQQQNPGGSSGSSYTPPGSEANGSYGSVRYENGTFIVPNQRATSDADIPKQSGPYGLNPIFWDRLGKLINDAAAQGYKITVTSGWRSFSSQLSLWQNSNRACSVRRQWVACPGGSRHGFGIAADLAFNGTSCSGSWNCNAAATWVHNNAARYGLVFRLSNEAWHIEPDKLTGGNFGACTYPC